MTYDQLLAQGQRLVEMLSAEQPHLFEKDQPVEEWDDLPF
jgi:hypothetical protein